MAGRDTIKVNIRRDAFGIAVPVSWTDQRARILKAFVEEHPEHRAQVLAEMHDHPREVPYVGQKRVVTGYERGVDPDTLDPITSQPRADSKEADWATYALVGREVHWRELD